MFIRVFTAAYIVVVRMFVVVFIVDLNVFCVGGGYRYIVRILGLFKNFGVKFRSLNWFGLDLFKKGFTIGIKNVKVFTGFKFFVVVEKNFCVVLCIMVEGWYNKWFVVFVIFMVVCLLI